jgi:hypothetical protein
MKCFITFAVEKLLNELRKKLSLQVLTEECGV